jgi:hypothetical protein
MRTKRNTKYKRSSFANRMQLRDIYSAKDHLFISHLELENENMPRALSQAFAAIGFPMTDQIFVNLGKEEKK